MADISKIKLPDGTTYDVKDNTKLPINTAGGIASCSGEGNKWYYQIATIKITTAYMNRPVVFEISGRNKQFSRLQIQFTNSNTTDPYLQYFSSDGDNEFYIKKTTTSTWEVYGKYSEQWGLSRLHRITGAGADIGVTVVMANIETLPSDTTQATYIGNVAYATNAGTVNNLTVQTAVPANAEFTDTKVTQTPTTENYSYEVLLAGSREGAWGSDTTKTEGVCKNEGLHYNPKLNWLEVRRNHDASTQDYSKTVIRPNEINFYSGARERISLSGIACYMYDNDYNTTLSIAPASGNISTVGNINCDGTVSANSVTCNSMSVTDISSQYTITKSSGNANLSEVKAHRSGNVVCMQIMLRGAGSTWSAGSNIFVGTVTGGPLPTVAVNGCGYYDNACFIARLNNSGSVTFRWLVSTKNNVASSQTIVATLTFITDN